MEKSPYDKRTLQYMRWLSGWRKGKTEREEAGKSAQKAGAPVQVTAFDEAGAVEGAGTDALLVDWLQQGLFAEVDG
jgi:hypothetical protein